MSSRTEDVSGMASLAWLREPILAPFGFGKRRGYFGEVLYKHRIIMDGATFGRNQIIPHPSSRRCNGHNFCQ